MVSRIVSAEDLDLPAWAFALRKCKYILIRVCGPETGLFVLAASAAKADS